MSPPVGRRDVPLLPRGGAREIQEENQPQIDQVQGDFKELGVELKKNPLRAGGAIALGVGKAAVQLSPVYLLGKFIGGKLR